MSRKSKEAEKKEIFKVIGGFLSAGMFLFLHVWVSVQSERSLLELKACESLLSRKKSELNELNNRYADLTSLPTLDQWAKTHGPWVPPGKTNVILIEK